MSYIMEIIIVFIIVILIKGKLINEWKLGCGLKCKRSGGSKGGLQGEQSGGERQRGRPYKGEPKNNKEKWKKS